MIEHLAVFWRLVLFNEQLVIIHISVAQITSHSWSKPNQFLNIFLFKPVSESMIYMEFDISMH